MPVRRLSDAQVADVYRRRWGVEIYFRHFKQTFERRKLRSRLAAHALVELTWSLLGLWCLGLYAQAQQIKHNVDPQQLSVAKALHAFRRMLRDYRHPMERNGSLAVLLKRAVRDTYHRVNKASRDYPRKKRRDRAAGPPQIHNATAAQITAARLIPATA